MAKLVKILNNFYSKYENIRGTADFPSMILEGDLDRLEMNSIYALLLMGYHNEKINNEE